MGCFPEEGVMPGMIIAVICLVVVLALAFWHDRRSRERAVGMHDMDEAWGRARGEADRHLPPSSGPGF